MNLSPDQLRFLPTADHNLVHRLKSRHRHSSFYDVDVDVDDDVVVSFFFRRILSLPLSPFDPQTSAAAAIRLPLINQISIPGDRVHLVRVPADK